MALVAASILLFGVALLLLTHRVSDPEGRDE
jgi:hypothetical protein